MKLRTQNLPKSLEKNFIAIALLEKIGLKSPTQHQIDLMESIVKIDFKNFINEIAYAKD